MSRIGKKPVVLPTGVTASVKNGEVKVKGPKGELSLRLVEGVEASVEKEGVVIKPRLKGLPPGDHGYEYVLSVLEKSLRFLGGALKTS